jgi:hypothetical protein
MLRVVKGRRHRFTAAAAAVFAAMALAAPLPAHADAMVAGGPQNTVIVQNHDDGALRVRGLVQLGRVPGPNVSPDNFAAAINTCSAGCQTLAVALQVNLVNSNYAVFAPQNLAVAANGGCNGCIAEAIALQYNIGVEDPAVVPPRVDQLVAAMKAEIAQVGAGSGSLGDAETGMLGVIGQFQDLAGSLITSRDVEVSPATSTGPATSQPTASATPTPAAAPAAAPVAAPTAAATPSPAPSPSPQPSPAATPSATPEPSPSPT